MLERSPVDSAVASSFTDAIRLVRNGHLSRAAFAIGAMPSAHEDPDLAGPLRCALDYLHSGDSARAEAVLHLCARYYRERFAAAPPRLRLVPALGLSDGDP